MNQLHATLLAAACALALSACGDDSRQAADTAAAPATVAPAETAPAAEAPAADVSAHDHAMAAAAEGDIATDATAEAAADATEAPPAATGGCSVEIEGNDMIRFNLSSITVPASCTDFTITLNHVGKLPVAAMGHNVVVTAASDMAAVAADGIAAGAAAGYIKAGDERVIAQTDLIGGGESASVTFAVSKIKDGGPYEFFCSFPGHAALMKGTISVQ